MKHKLSLRQLWKSVFNKDKRSSFARWKQTCTAHTSYGPLCAWLYLVLSRNVRSGEFSEHHLLLAVNRRDRALLYMQHIRTARSTETTIGIIWHSGTVMACHKPLLFSLCCHSVKRTIFFFFSTPPVHFSLWTGSIESVDRWSLMTSSCMKFMFWYKYWYKYSESKAFLWHLSR